MRHFLSYVATMDSWMVLYSNGNRPEFCSVEKLFSQCTTLLDFFFGGWGWVEEWRTVAQ